MQDTSEECFDDDVEKDTSSWITLAQAAERVRLNKNTIMAATIKGELEFAHRKSPRGRPSRIVDPEKVDAWSEDRHRRSVAKYRAETQGEPARVRSLPIEEDRINLFKAAEKFRVSWQGLLHACKRGDLPSAIDSMRRHHVRPSDVRAWKLARGFTLLGRQRPRRTRPALSPEGNLVDGSSVEGERRNE